MAGPFSCADAADVLWRVYGRRGEALPLAGEPDVNFLICAETGEEYVLKIMRPGCDPGLIECHVRAMEPALDGRPYSEDGGRLVWMVTLRTACGFEPDVHSRAVRTYLEGAEVAPVLAGIDIEQAAVFDLGVGSLLLGADPRASETASLTATLERATREAGASCAVGRYGEARALYPSDAYGSGPHPTDERRTIHLGMDLFAPAGTAVCAPLDGTVEAFADNAAPFDYGPVIILRHSTGDGLPFFTLYGHLSRRSLEGLQAGSAIGRGEPFGTLGSVEENGGWAPHLHLQIITGLMGLGCDFPGVAYPRLEKVFRILSPDPNLIVRVPVDRFPRSDMDFTEARALRQAALGSNLRLSYKRPLKIVRGWRQFLYDDAGQAHLDFYNTVALVGHSHPRVVEAAARQMALLNTNTRYLHDTILRYAQRLTAKLPEPLSVWYFVNSGSEATELALRLARAHTRGRDAIVLEHAYHGFTTTALNMSPQKLSGAGGGSPKPWIHVAPVPDRLRGTDIDYAGRVAEIAASIHESGRGLAAFFAESLPSTAGQIVLPEGYLREAYRAVRAAGGVCVAAEAQTGFGRLGEFFWGFESQGVTPDIVVLGKPMGNGFPLAGVVTTPEIAESFDNGMEFFSTFGGNPVACAAGLAVLDAIEQEGLQENARQMGLDLVAALNKLKRRNPAILDVRGMGLFLGVEVTGEREAAYIVERLRERRILTGAGGPRCNVIKIRPPLVIESRDVERFIEVFEGILGESALRLPGDAGTEVPVAG